MAGNDSILLQLKFINTTFLPPSPSLVHPRSRERHFEERRVIKPTRAEETRLLLELLLGSGLSDSFSGNQKMHFPVSSQAPLAPILMIYYDTIWFLRRGTGGGITLCLGDFISLERFRLLLTVKCSGHAPLQPPNDKFPIAVSAIFVLCLAATKATQLQMQIQIQIQFTDTDTFTMRRAAHTLKLLRNQQRQQK